MSNLILFAAFLGLFLAPLSAQKKAKAKPSAAVQLFVKTATGIYDNQKTIEQTGVDTMATPAFRRQFILCYPVWQQEVSADRWMYFGWYAPNDRDVALEEVFLRVYDDKGSLRVDWYQIPEKMRENFSQEWKKERPFEKLLPVDLMHEEDGLLFASCAARKDGDGFMMKAENRGEFKRSAVAAYKYLFIEMGFYSDKYTSGSQFIAADGETVIIQHDHKFTISKVNKKYKTF